MLLFNEYGRSQVEISFKERERKILQFFDWAKNSFEFSYLLTHPRCPPIAFRDFKIMKYYKKFIQLMGFVGISLKLCEIY